jgi:fluoride ion exporter CrcB/FEX
MTAGAGQRLTARDLGRIAVGGALGTGVRMLLITGAASLLIVNVLGAAALGALRSAAERWSFERQERLLPLLATGLLGGLTTFSTMVVVAGRLGHDAGLIVPGTSRMTGAGLALAGAYLAVSVLLGLAVFLAARAVARRLLVGQR